MEFNIYTDCSDLIDNFVKRREGTFESFCEEWKLLQFQDIFLVQTSHIEVLNTTQAIFHVCKRILCGRNTNGDMLTNPDEEELEEAYLRRAGALYLMYAIYFKQPAKQYVKIVVSIETWKEMQQFLVMKAPTDSIGQLNRYIFMILNKENAFQFSAMDYCIGLENLVNYDIRQVDLRRRDAHHVASQLQLSKEINGICNVKKMLPSVIKLEDNYNTMKKKLANNRKDSGSHLQPLPETTIFKDISAFIDKVQKVLDEPVKINSKSDATNDSSDESDDDTVKKQLPTKKSQAMWALLMDCEDKSEKSEDSESSSSKTNENEPQANKVSFTSLAQLLEDVIQEDLT